MNCGEKFPYALLTFSKKLIAGLILIIPLPQKADYGINTHHTPLQILSRPIISHISYSTPTAPEPHTPSPKHTPIPHTPILPPHSKVPSTHSTIPTTPPIPLLLRVDSDEMRQNRQVLGSWGAGNARKGPRMGPKVHEVDSALARAQTKVDEVYGPYGSSPNPAEFAPSKFPQTLKYFRKPHK